MKPAAGMRFDIAGKTDAGCVRSNNEDNLAVDEAVGLLMVADGMGGHNAGEVASRLAVETVLEYARKMIGATKRVLPQGGNPALSALGRQLEYFVKMANTIIYEKARHSPQNQGMGTTIVAVLLDGGAAAVAHVGDSRCYVLRNGLLQLLTQDHSLVMDQVRRGLITAQEAEDSSLQNVLIRALGTEEEVEVDIQEHPLLPNDILLLCTDGLTKMVSDDRIAGALKTGKSSAEMCDSLVELARAAGGLDNITVVVARALRGGGRGMQGFFKRIFDKK